ncbi:serine/threonine-protein kinase [Nannocystis sp. SCPEA4]|uniref:serine/threonine-protein kinase n=1 Tax=Nannocystis sp. SCPEA4 TaxID=2996787 RepID=UPI00226EFCDE|nr:serine/threonine-protein kinase [Nannocystis sp. SCPEA4]MCY1060185.1 serine/threonine-protein kinase [Nannocystis sp. SCPEA4]
MIVTEPEQLDWPKGETTAPAYWSPGTLVRGRFRIKERIGRGGMGEVYRAYDEAILRSVAIKICRDPLADMAAEAKILAQLRHPNVISVHEYVQGTPAFVVMELAAGHSLDEYLTRRKAQQRPLAPALFVALARPIVAGLAACHARGVTHRDLKPQNILINEDGGAFEVKLCDFGIASLRRRESEDLSTLRVSASGEGQIVGSRLYMAPEQWDGDSPGSASDVYSLGCVLYELLTGAPPFPDVPWIAELHRGAPRPRPSRRARRVGARLDALIVKMMAIEPTERPADALAVAQALEQAISRRAAVRWTAGGMTLISGGIAALLALKGSPSPTPYALADDEPQEPAPPHTTVIPLRVGSADPAAAPPNLLEPRQRRTERPPRRRPAAAAARTSAPAVQPIPETSLSALVRVAEGVLAANQRVTLRFRPEGVRLDSHNLNPSTQAVLRKYLAPYTADAAGKALACGGGRCTWGEE